ncbi:hypothetical protein [Synechococcus sp. Minos11]|uniref:hypothetical protein n=1 Tax=Synechococcus sp. Minos11 TaxID=221341 RepID=UPI001648D451|nr:hypothetical protein [Synechococcus sp. Minos11]
MGQAERETAAKTAVSALEMQADGTGQKIGNAWLDTKTLASGSNHNSFRFSSVLFVAIRTPRLVFLPTFGDLLRSKMPPERINTLKWESNGELSAHDVFELVKRLKQQEQPACSSQLLHLVNKHRHSSKIKKAAPSAAS